MVRLGPALISTALLVCLSGASLTTHVLSVNLHSDVFLGYVQIYLDLLLFCFMIYDDTLKSKSC